MAESLGTSSANYGGAMQAETTHADYHGAMWHAMHNVVGKVSAKCATKQPLAFVH